MPRGAIIFAVWDLSFLRSKITLQGEISFREAGPSRAVLGRLWDAYMANEGVDVEWDDIWANVGGMVWDRPCLCGVVLLALRDLAWALYRHGRSCRTVDILLYYLRR